MWSVRPTARSSSSTDLVPVVALARVLAATERHGPDGASAGVEWEDNRVVTWDRLREALRPVAEADRDSALGRIAAGVRDATDDRILRLDRGHALSDAPEGRIAALAQEPELDVVACAFALDDLRRLNETGRISGELGWAMRRWAWTELHRALARLDGG